VVSVIEEIEDVALRTTDMVARAMASERLETPSDIKRTTAMACLAMLSEIDPMLSATLLATAIAERTADSAREGTESATVRTVDSRRAAFSLMDPKEEASDRVMESNLDAVSFTDATVSDIDLMTRPTVLTTASEMDDTASDVARTTAVEPLTTDSVSVESASLARR